MKNILQSSILLFFLMQSAFLFSQTIQVKIVGIEKVNTGKLYATLIGNEKDYHYSEAALKSFHTTVDNDTIIYEFTNVPKGVYAINVLHDENYNQKMDTNMFGFPYEGFGVSNNPTIIGPPSFETTSFTFDGKKLNIVIEMNYL